MELDEICANGLNGATGNYLLPDLSAHDLALLAMGEKSDPLHSAELQLRHEQVSQPNYNVIEDEDGDACNLARSGWGVVFARDAKPEIREALKPLLDHRRNQATQEKPLYKEYANENGYAAGESKPAYLARLPHCVGSGRGVGSGPADPSKVPYYLLLAGDPESIPFQFQYQLDIQYAVGRICFDTPDEYAAYARNVVESETKPAPRPRRAVFFGVRNDGDKATRLSADGLVAPLADKLKAKLARWDIESVLRNDATKVRLAQLLGENAPAFLFTASHGVAFPNGDARQLPDQGALVCQDWPGPIVWKGPISNEHYFAAGDVGHSAALKGAIAFFFACFGAGTPHTDDYAHLARRQAELAPRAFLSKLPQRLLTRGVLAVVGHVERAWACSFSSSFGPQLGVFEAALLRLLRGQPVGRAMEYFNDRYAELSSELTARLKDLKEGAPVRDGSLSNLWTANTDARSYAIIGDPAVRCSTTLPVEV